MPELEAECLLCLYNQLGRLALRISVLRGETRSTGTLTFNKHARGALGKEGDTA